jgi:cytochrome c oxidase cbb3-type subunit 1
MTTVAEATSKTTAVPVSPQSSSATAMAASARAEIVERALIDASTRIPVLTFFAAAVGWLLLSTGLALIASFKLHRPEFLGGLSVFTYGRIYPAYTNAFLYGWGCQVGMGVAIWLMARLCRVSLRAPGVLVYGALIWNVGVAAGVGSILLGQMRPFEMLEMPAFCHVLMFIGFVMIGLWGAVLYRHRRTTIPFISVWYLLGALFWFPWIFATANVLLSREEVRGVVQAIVGAWYAQNLIGWWFTAVGLATAYFLIPKVIDRPVHSYHLASLGFWTFAFFSGLTAAVRLSGGPVPVWLVTVSISASIMMLVPVATVTVNLISTMQGRYDMVYNSPTIRFTFFGAICFAIGSVLSILSTLRSVNALVHFTPFPAGVHQILLYSFFSMVMFGAIYYITPRLVGCEWLSSTMISLHFWGSAYGGALVASLLLFAGMAQAQTFSDPDSTFAQIIQNGLVYFPGRTICLLLVAFGHLVFALHFLLMLLKIGQPGGEATRFTSEEEAIH